MTGTERPTPIRHSTSRPRTGERVRHAARHLFYQQGIRAVSVEQIVQTAGIAKPSLYRIFPSKDSLAVAYLEDDKASFWECFESALAQHPNNACAGLMTFFDALSQRARTPGFRGSGLTNAALEFPEQGHPVRQIGETAKRDLLARLHTIAQEVGAPDAQLLADGLLVIIEGVYACGQLFADGGPAASARILADLLIEACLRARS